MSLVKICGLSTPDTLEAALAAGADMVGFVFFAPSPRHIDLDAATELGRQVRGRASKVALTVNASDDDLDVVVLTLRPDMLQLHGRESPERVAAVRERYGLPIAKAFGVAEAGDLVALADYRGLVDWTLLDAKPPRDAALPGGNGRRFDWSILDGFQPPASLMLSGGLDAANVQEAVARVRPVAVDVSSGVEDRPGVKNPERIREFIETAKAAFAQPAHAAQVPA